LSSSVIFELLPQNNYITPPPRQQPAFALLLTRRTFASLRGQRNLSTRVFRKSSMFSFVNREISDSCSIKGQTSSTTLCQSMVSIHSAATLYQFFPVISGPGQLVCLSAFFKYTRLGSGQAGSERYHIRSYKSLPFT